MRSELEEQRIELEERRRTYAVRISWLRCPSLEHSSTSRTPVASANWLKLNFSLQWGLGDL